MEDWPCFQISQGTKTAKIKLQEVLQYVGWWRFQYILISKQAWEVFRISVNSSWSLELHIPSPLCTLICYTVSHNKALPFSTNTAHMIHMDSLANQHYYRCCNCAIKQMRETHILQWLYLRPFNNVLIRLLISSTSVYYCFMHYHVWVRHEHRLK